MRILIIEDEIDLLKSLSRGLKDEGYAVDTANDGEEGLFSALSNDYDAILLDVMLPKLDGWKILEKLRTKKKTPVLMLTARDQTADRVRGLDSGADDYLIKPFNLEEVLARIRAIIRRSTNHTSNSIIIGDVALNLASKTVTLKSEPVDLTAREYSLVEFLALHKGEVITRTQLYEHLFDENESSLSNLLDVHVSKIRKKLGPDFVVTRRGHGYCVG
jgi:two-component system OmpR family response regulator